MTNQPLEITAVFLRIAPCYCSLFTNYGSELLQMMTNLLQITAKHYCKLWQLYYKLQQCVITNYGSFIANYVNVSFQITTTLSNYYKLRELLVLLQHIITNYGRYYKLRRYYKLCRNSFLFFFINKTFNCANFCILKSYLPENLLQSTIL